MRSGYVVMAGLGPRLESSTKVMVGCVVSSCTRAVASAVSPVLKHLTQAVRLPGRVGTEARCVKLSVVEKVLPSVTCGFVKSYLQEARLFVSTTMATGLLP